MKKVDILIVGQGLAGSVLAIDFLRSGYTVQVIDSGSASNASRVAAGLYNPITGRNMVKTWLADEIFAGLDSYYSDLELFLSAKFHYPGTIYRPFVSIAEQNDWMAKHTNPAYSDYVQKYAANSVGDEHILDPFGGLFLKLSGYIDLPVLLDSAQSYLKDKGAYELGLFDFQELDVNQKIYQTIGFEKLIFCEGTSALANPFWKHLKFKPVKGEILTIKSDFKANFILNRGVFMIRKGDFVRLGSTYENQDLAMIPTTKGLEQLQEKMRKIYTGLFAVVDHQVGIRPATYDRRPFIGFHHDMNHIGIFNGFGAKGVSLVPYFAKHLIDHLSENASLMKEVSVSR